MLGNISDFNPNSDYVNYEDRAEIDRYIMYKANKLVETVVNAYENYDFHIVYNEVHKFASSELSSKYLDVVKDRLYTLDAKNTLRLSIQSTMYDITLALVTLLAPILSFTAEEVYGYMNLRDEDKKDSVLLLDMAKESSVYENEELAKKWDKIYDLKEEILVELEHARAEKTIGHPLDAKVTIYEMDQKAEELKELQEVLEMVLIVSKVEIKEGEKHIEVSKAAGLKCERCWKYNEHVGENEEHSTICPRCIEAIIKN